MRAHTIFLVSFALGATGYANPPNEARGMLAGANHHIGDAGFIASHGRTPLPADEHARIHDHFTYVRAILASRPATRPEFAERRRQLLHYFDDYIAKDIAPLNVHVPWRTPVFIDDHGTICAVGYLIEQSVGRALPEQIAVNHRYDYIEDIANAMPEVAAWVASSGFTLDELASIQPGYEIASIDMWSTWNFQKRPVEDGEYTDDLTGARGHFLRGRMEGAWTIVGDNAALRGRGFFHAGAGRWQSFEPDGKPLAEGPFIENVPHGEWTFFHPSGRVAARGNFENGYPRGAWTFFHDDDDGLPIAKGHLSHGTAFGSWQHFDEHGKVFAESHDATPASWTKLGRSGYLLSVVPGADRVEHQVHEGRGGNDENRRLDMFALDGERIFVTDKEEVFDATAHQLVRSADGTWASAACEWTPRMKAAARRGDLARLHGLLDHGYSRDLPTCAKSGPAIRAARGEKLDRMLASVHVVHAQSPQFIRDLALGNEDAEISADLADVLARNMSWYIEWPHVHGKIVAVYATLPGFSSHYAYSDTMAQMGMN
jgi:hypothetical protein